MVRFPPRRARPEADGADPIPPPGRRRSGPGASARSAGTRSGAAVRRGEAATGWCGSAPPSPEPGPRRRGRPWRWCADGRSSSGNPSRTSSAVARPRPGAGCYSGPAAGATGRIPAAKWPDRPVRRARPHFWPLGGGGPRGPGPGHPPATTVRVAATPRPLCEDEPRGRFVRGAACARPRGKPSARRCADIWKLRRGGRAGAGTCPVPQTRPIRARRGRPASGNRNGTRRASMRRRV